jgi:hypothetical protein
VDSAAVPILIFLTRASVAWSFPSSPDLAPEGFLCQYREEVRQWVRGISPFMLSKDVFDKSKFNKVNI